MVDGCLSLSGCKCGPFDEDLGFTDVSSNIVSFSLLHLAMETFKQL